MQEEIENRTVNLAISTTKLTGRAIIAGFQKYMQHRAKAKAQKASKEADVPHGKQTVKELIGQNQGVSSIEIQNTGIRDFERVARKYGVDFAIQKDKSVTPPKYLVFFKARDADALTAAFHAYSAKVLNREKKPSLLKQLSKLKDMVVPAQKKIRHKSQEQEL